jgi:hypothetical protein
MLYDFNLAIRVDTRERGWRSKLTRFRGVGLGIAVYCY